MTFGIIVTTRSFFSDHLVDEARKNILDKLDQLGHQAIILSLNDTNLGAVVSFEDAKKCADLFKCNSEKIDGIIVVLPNFGEETGIAEAIRLSNLKVPVLVQACDDSIDKLDLNNRRDAFCGKISVCNNLYQRGIKFTNTSTHTCKIDSKEFDQDLESFSAVCRVVKGISNARIGAIGTRPNAFQTVRFSEKLLQASGISVIDVDLSEIIFKATSMNASDPSVQKKVEDIRSYGCIDPKVDYKKIIAQAKLCVTLDEWVKTNECDASAIQCWDSIQNNYGCATCLAMSMMGERGLPSACEMDVMGAVTMYAMYLASNQPSGYLDWNNNYEADQDKCICLHCSNFPKSFIATKFEISNLDVLATTIGAERCFGACKAQIAAGNMTYAKISTDDVNGKIKVYLGEGEFLGEKVDTKGGVALCHIRGLQNLMNYICKHGFEHHVAMNRSKIADVLEEALGNYMGWDVYRHN
jgi:L-fucose isomerase-like protein